MTEPLTWIQAWVQREFARADGRTANPWVQIETLDPGWSVTISLTGTTLVDVEFSEVEIVRSESNWVRCWVDGGVRANDLEWQGRGGAGNLVELLELFRRWSETHTVAREQNDYSA